MNLLFLAIFLATQPATKPAAALVECDSPAPTEETVTIKPATPSATPTPSAKAKAKRPLNERRARVWLV
ncbi:hypothetical protein MASR2M8_12020 [Opitutaceae bacterium]